MKTPERDVTLTRAANFFALLTFWKNPKQAAEVWRQLKDHVNVSVPLDMAALGVFGRLDIDEDAMQQAVEAARSSLDRLDDTDLVIELGDPRYPKTLAMVAGAPEFLFVRTNDLAIFDVPAIAVVGTRHPTEEGKHRARKLAYLLAKHGLAVSSGLAKGIDTAAHCGALDFDGKTIGVLGTPLTTSYPKENSELQRMIGRVGAVVSQFHPGAVTTRLSFPARNASMSGLSLGTVIVEASETSGALIQAQQCLAQGRKLFIPKSAVGNHALSWPRKYLTLGAKQFSAIDELLQILRDESLIPPQTSTAAVAQVEVYPAHAVGG